MLGESPCLQTLPCARAVRMSCGFRRTGRPPVVTPADADAAGTGSDLPSEGEGLGSDGAADRVTESQILLVWARKLIVVTAAI